MTLTTTSKTGTMEYLGIKIDYDLDKELDDFSLLTLKDRYFWENETHAQEAFARASVFSATYKGVTDFDLAQRLYDYASKHWFMFSTPSLYCKDCSRLVICVLGIFALTRISPCTGCFAGP